MNKAKDQKNRYIHVVSAEKISTQRMLRNMSEQDDELN